MSDTNLWNLEGLLTSNEKFSDGLFNRLDIAANSINTQLLEYKALANIGNLDVVTFKEAPTKIRAIPDVISGDGIRDSGAGGTENIWNITDTELFTLTLDISINENIMTFSSGNTYQIGINSAVDISTSSTLQSTSSVSSTITFTGTLYGAYKVSSTSENVSCIGNLTQTTQAEVIPTTFLAKLVNPTTGPITVSDFAITLSDGTIMHYKGNITV